MVEDEEMNPDDEEVIARYLQRRQGGQEHPDRAWRRQEASDE